MNILLEGCDLECVKHKLPNGKTLVLKELTTKQRRELGKLAKGDSVEAQAKVIIMACDDLEDADLDALLAMSGKLITAISDRVLEISGLGDEEEVKKD